MTNQLRSPLRSSLRSPFEHRRGGFNPALLSPSAFYDRTVLSSMFQDSAGSVPLTAAAQPLGKAIDGSGLGNDSIQSTAGKRPIIGLVPAGGRRNLLTYTEDFGNAAWVLSAVETPVMTGAVAEIKPTAINTQHSFTRLPEASAETWTVEVKANGLNKVSLREGYVTGAYIAVNLSDGSLISSGNGVTAYSITDVGSGWWRISLKKSTVNFGAKINLLPNSYTVGDPNGVPFAGDGTSGIFIRYPQLELGSTATPYQKVVSSFDVTEAGKPDCWYADFDAIDDDIVTTFPTSLGSGCTVCRSLPATGASITTGVTIGTTYTDNVDAHALLIFTAAQWSALSAGQISQLTAWLNKKAGL